MTVQATFPATVSSLLPHIGLPDWKLGQRVQPSDEDARHLHRSSSRRRTSDRAERRESISRSKQTNMGSEKDRDKSRLESRSPSQQESPPRHHRELGSSRRRPPQGERPPQMEIEFVKDSSLKKPLAVNDSKRQEIAAENALFSYPWKWPRVEVEHTVGGNRETRSREMGRTEGTDDSERVKGGVPSVIFAVRDGENGAAGGPLSITASSTAQSLSSPISPTSRRSMNVMKQRLQAQLQTSEPERHRRHQHQHETLQSQKRHARSPPPLPPHIKRQQHQRQHQHRHRRLQPDEDSSMGDREPIEPKPQVPILVGGQEDPIPCSESLLGSVHRRYSLGKGGRWETKRRPPSYQQIALLKKQTIHDLTGLESVSTYELEQRYMVNDVQDILARKANGDEQIALPKLTHSHFQRRSTHGRTMGYDTDQVTPGALDPTKQQAGKRRSVSPPGRIGSKIVYNLSNSSQERQMKVHASIKSHSASISDSLDRMRFNLRQKQSLLSHAVFDMNARQKHEDMAPIADRLRNNLDVSQRKPDTVPLLKNQNYISDIFSDIASKMNQSNRPAKQRDDGDEPARIPKAPYMPTISALIQSRRTQLTDKDSRRSKSRERDRQDRPYDEVSPPKGRGQQHPDADPSLIASPIQWPAIEQNIMSSIHITNPCSMTSPITEQFSTFMTPSPPAKNDPSLYLPNIRSKHTHSSTLDTKLPFRPSAKASTPKDIFRGSLGKGENSRFTDVRDVIDVTSRASSVQVRNVIDVTDQASNDASLVHRPSDARYVLSFREGPQESPRCGKADVIDVTSLSSSRISKTTVKNVTCVDEDSEGYIRIKRKLSAMSKSKNHHRSKGPPPTMSTGLRRIGAQALDVKYPSQTKHRNVNDEADVDVDVDFTMSRTQAEDQRFPADFGHRDYFTMVQNEANEARYQYETRDTYTGRNDITALDDEMEEEIVFAPSPTANQGLFEGIWDVLETPVDSSLYLKELPTRSLPIATSRLPSREDEGGYKPGNYTRTSIAAPATSFEMKAPFFMSPYSQEQRSKQIGCHTMRDPLQPPEVQADFKARSPMEASATGPDIETASPVIRSSSRLAASYSPTPLVIGDKPLARRSFSPLGRSISPLGKAPNRLWGRSSTPLPRAPSRLGKSSIPITKNDLTGELGAPELHGGESPTVPNRRTYTPVLPWAARPHISLLRRQDAPIVDTKTPREPEGSVIVMQDAEETPEVQEASSETPMSKDRPHPDVVRPLPVRRASALSKREKSCERSTETKSVTFQEPNKKSLSPRKDSQIPNFICTSITPDVSWRRSKGVRGKNHPWHKETESTSSSREAFHDLSTRSLEYADDEEKRRRRVEAFDKANSSRDNGRNGSKSYRRSMYDEVRDATSSQDEVIILDEQGSLQHEGYPAGSRGRPHHTRLEKLWDDTCNSVQLSFQSHGMHWETLGDYRIKAAHRPNHDTGSNPSRPSRSRRSSKQEIVSDHEARESGLFFDFLCF